MADDYIQHAQLGRLARSVAPNRVVVVYGRPPRRRGDEVDVATRLRAPRAWRAAYPAGSFRVVDRENYLDFITGG